VAELEVKLAAVSNSGGPALESTVDATTTQEELKGESQPKILGDDSSAEETKQKASTSKKEGEESGNKTSNFGFGFSRKKADQAEVIRLYFSVFYSSMLDFSLCLSAWSACFTYY